MTTDTIDPFALARQDDTELRPDEQVLLEAYRALPPETATLAARIVEVLGRDPECLIGNHKPIAPPPPPRNQHDTDRLRVAAEELAAAYRAPLPEGDDGLITAIQRWRDLEPLHSFAKRGFPYTFKDEDEIIVPISNAAETEFEHKIEAWPVQGLAGAAAKLRYMVESDHVDIEDIDGEQLIEVIEREIGRAAR